MSSADLKHLLVQLEAVAETGKKLPDLGEADGIPLLAKRIAEVPQALRSPQERAFGISEAAPRRKIKESHDFHFQEPSAEIKHAQRQKAIYAGI